LLNGRRHPRSLLWRSTAASELGQDHRDRPRAGRDRRLDPRRRRPGEAGAQRASLAVALVGAYLGRGPGPRRL